MKNLLVVAIESARNWGWLLAIVVAVAAFALAAQGLNPVKEGVDQVASSIGFDDSPCKSGWKFIPPEADGSVVSPPRCIKDGYVAFMDPQDPKVCQYVMDTGTEDRPGQGELGCELAGYR